MRVLIAGCVLAVSVSVHAQTKVEERKVVVPEKKKSRDRFFDFEGLVIDGELRKPGAFFTSAREKVRFERLLRLRRSFLTELERSAEELRDRLPPANH